MRKLTSNGAILSSIFASACCIIPVFLAGVAGIAGLASSLEKFRPIFILIAVVLLGYGFYVAYFQKQSQCAEGEVCATPKGKHRQRIILWMTTLLVVAAITLPYWIGMIF